jgi:hypothetical protein
MNILAFWIICALVTVLGILGVVMAANAVDFGISVFGIALAVFSVLYNYWAVVYYEADPA